MAITRLTKHDTHEISVHLCRWPSKHYAALRCVECNKHIQWLSYTMADDLKNMGVEIKDKHCSRANSND